MEGAEFFKLPLGHADFVRLRAENCIYVDISNLNK